MEFTKAVDLGEKEKQEIPGGWGGVFKEPPGTEMVEVGGGGGGLK